MTEKPFWDYSMAEIMTPELAEELGHEIFRARTGEEPLALGLSPSPPPSRGE